MFLPGNLIKISDPGCYMKINARPCCKELDVAFSDLCRITQRSYRKLDAETPDSWTKAFSFIYPLSLNLKNKGKAVQNIIFPWHLLKCHLNETKQCFMFLWVTEMAKSP